jgi:polar amino acid transport system permease protein
MKFDFTIIVQYLPQLLWGLLVTIEICLVALCGAFVLGLAIALMRTSPSVILRATATVYVDVIRNVPFMVQVFMLFYVMPFFGVRLSPMTIGIVSLMIFGTAYYGEVMRAGINAVARSQYESGRSAGLGHLETMWRIVLPQSIPFLIPTMTNNTISLVKESAILSTITVPELTAAAQRVTGITFSPFEVFLMVAVLYWLVSFAIVNAAAAIGSWLLGARIAR